jgi:hypothetical protein
MVAKWGQVQFSVVDPLPSPRAMPAQSVTEITAPKAIDNSYVNA